MDIFYVLVSILLLVVLIAWAKIQPFLAFLLTSIVAAVLLKLPLAAIPGSLEKGIGSTLSSLLGIICIGAMFGKLVAQSGAAQKIAREGLTVRMAEKLVKDAQTESKPQKTKTVDHDTLRLQNELTAKLGAKVVIEHNDNGAGKLVIAYSSLEELDGILEQIGQLPR